MFSEDEFVDYCVVEAVTAKVRDAEHAANEKARKDADPEAGGKAWKAAAKNKDATPHLG